MDTYLLKRAGFSAHAEQLDTATATEDLLRVEADWLADMLEKYPPIDQSAWATLKRQATVHPPLPLNRVSLDGVDLESQQVTDQLYALSALRDSDRFPQGYQAIRLEYGEDQVAILVHGLVRRPPQRDTNIVHTHKFLVAVLGTSLTNLEHYAESISPSTAYTTDIQQRLHAIRQEWRPQPHESRRVERAARTARFLDRKGLFAILAIAAGILAGFAFSAAGVMIFAYAFLLVFSGVLLGSRALHHQILRRVGLPAGDSGCLRGHGRPRNPGLTRAPISSTTSPRIG